jgi:uncharacterized protein (TIGR02453 family)
MSEFQGFFPDTFTFLSDIRANNNKIWFEQNRQVYETYILNPLRGLVARLAQTIQHIDPALEVRPQIGKTISRIFRDTRFSKDKSPLRDHMWISFKEPGTQEPQYPVFYFYISPDEWGYGMGYWEASRSTMDLFRNQVRTHIVQFQRIINNRELTSKFQVSGNMYKRPITPDLPDDVRNYTERKSFYLGHAFKDLTPTFAPKIADSIASAYEILAPLYLFIVHSFA